MKLSENCIKDEAELPENVLGALKSGCYTDSNLLGMGGLNGPVSI